MTVQCCRCGKVRTETGNWEQPQHTAEPVSHSYCGPCGAMERARVSAELAFYRSSVAVA